MEAEIFAALCGTLWRLFHWFHSYIVGNSIRAAARKKQQQNDSTPSENTDQHEQLCPVLSESSLCAQWVAQDDPRFLHADREDSDQNGWMI